MGLRSGILAGKLNLEEIRSELEDDRGDTGMISQGRTACIVRRWCVLLDKVKGPQNVTGAAEVSVESHDRVLLYIKVSW